MNPSVIASQIRASLQMLRSAIETCPDELWSRETDHNRSWVLAYHTVYFAHLYLSATLEGFQPFERTVQGHAGYGREDLGDWSTLTDKDVFAKADVLSYLYHVDGRVVELVASTPLGAPSGFHWLPFTKGEAHLYNLRHIQHHAGQLTERIRQAANLGTKWSFQVRELASEDS